MHIAYHPPRRLAPRFPIIEMPNVDHTDPAWLGIFGAPDVVDRGLRAYEESGVDQVMLVAQAGGYPHYKMMESLRLFGREVLPAIKERDQSAQEAKAERVSWMRAQSELAG